MRIKERGLTQTTLRPVSRLAIGLLATCLAVEPVLAEKVSGGTVITVPTKPPVTTVTKPPVTTVTTPPVTTVTTPPTGGTSSGGGTAAAFTNPDDGNIPDRSKHPIAFPTAIGFGKVTSVRSPNAVVYKINSLLDVADPNDGLITYRECALALAVSKPYSIPSGRPRYCVFDVSGAIHIQSPAWITVPKIYIAGQTSPGGIEFRLGSSYNPVDSLIDTRKGQTDLIVRHVRARTGEHPGRISDNGDPIRLNGTRNQILDHVTTQYGTDESLEADCINCTVQWSIVGPNICRNAGHTSNLHCKTFFMKPSKNITVAHTLSMHGEQRGLNAAPGTAPIIQGEVGQADFVNNVLYNFVSEQGIISNQFGDVYANYVGNVSFRGPKYNGNDGNHLIGLYAGAARYPTGFRVFANSNVTPRTRISGQFGQTVTDPQTTAAGFVAGTKPSSVCGIDSAGNQSCGTQGLRVVSTTWQAKAPGNAGLSVDSTQYTTPERAMRGVLAYGGADLCRDGSCRDNVDKAFIDDVRTCDAAPVKFDGNWASTAKEAFGYATFSPKSAKLDSDNDGMPDDWEKLFKNTNPRVADANADPDRDGYPNIEEYLADLAQDDVRYRGFIGSASGSLPKYNCGRPMFP